MSTKNLAAKKSDVAPSKGKTLADFKEKFDKSYIVPKKIQAGLAKLGGGWETELEFARLAEVSVNDLALYREQFVDFTVALTGESRGKRVWAGTKAVAAKMREMLS